LAADVLFDFNKSAIRPDAGTTLTLHQATTLIRSKSRGVVRIEGYTDAKGGGTFNLRLSDRRAAAVKAWLVAKEGFGAGAFRTQGFGAAHPVAPNTKPGGGDPVGRQRNRRVELIVSK
jgi:outer membrane protein OmpA-like peptidoglycan-associated protein